MMLTDNFVGGKHVPLWLEMVLTTRIAFIFAAIVSTAISPKKGLTLMQFFI